MLLSCEREILKEKYHILDRYIKRSCIEDKNAWLEGQAFKVQAAANRTDSKRVWNNERNNWNEEKLRCTDQW